MTGIIAIGAGLAIGLAALGIGIGQGMESVWLVDGDAQVYDIALCLDLI